MKAVCALCVLYLMTAEICLAQEPVGTIQGVARDPSGGAVAGAQIKLVSLATGLPRMVTTSSQGDYSFPALLAGEYELSTDAQGFQRTIRRALVEAGTTTTADLDLKIGEVTESATVSGASPQMHYDSNTVSGLVTHSQIANLPLNGRSFLELAKLEPGVQPPTRASGNRIFVPVLGQPQGGSGRGTRVTVDGGSIMEVGNGGSAMNFSQEVVQELQISTVNLDLSTGITNGAAVNQVTRSGGNYLHGDAFYFWRDQCSRSRFQIRLPKKDRQQSCGLRYTHGSRRLTMVRIRRCRLESFANTAIAEVG